MCACGEGHPDLDGGEGEGGSPRDPLLGRPRRVRVVQGRVRHEGHRAFPHLQDGVVVWGTIHAMTSLNPFTCSTIHPCQPAILHPCTHPPTVSSLTIHQVNSALQPFYFLLFLGGGGAPV